MISTIFNYNYMKSTGQILGLFIGTAAAQVILGAGMAYSISKYTLPPDSLMKAFNLLPENPISFRLAFPLVLGSILATDVAILPPILAVNHVN